MKSRIIRIVAQLRPIRVEHAIGTVFERYGEHINLNLFISDGEMLYVFHHYPGKPVYLVRRSRSMEMRHWYQPVS